MNMTRKLIDWIHFGRNKHSRIQAEIGMGTALLPNNISFGHLIKSHEDPENVGGQGRLAMCHDNLNDGRDQRFA